MKTSMQELLDEVISEREKSISVEFREALDFVITAIKKDYKEIEKQQQGYSEEDLKYAFDSGRVRLTFDKKRPFVFKNYEEFIEQFKNK